MFALILARLWCWGLCQCLWCSMCCLFLTYGCFLLYCGLVAVVIFVLVFLGDVHGSCVFVVQVVCCILLGLV